MNATQDIRSSALRLTRDGAEHYPNVLSESEISSLRDLCDGVIGSRPGTRLYGSKVVEELLSNGGKVGGLAGRLLGSLAMPVRAVIFDKSADTNWALGWHQDRTIAVRKRVEVEGFGPWTVKAGLMHVEPPFEITQNMITIRLHLDDVDDRNAPLQISPGSHNIGRITASEIPKTVARLGSLSCLAQTGDAWVYSTSILHASERAVKPRRRRVLQVDYSTSMLPGGLEWAGIGS